MLKYTTIFCQMYLAPWTITLVRSGELFEFDETDGVYILLWRKILLQSPKSSPTPLKYWYLEYG